MFELKRSERIFLVSFANLTSSSEGIVGMGEAAADMDVTSSTIIYLN
jgi:hypothetical protein